MESFNKLVQKKNGNLQLDNLKNYKKLGRGADGSVFELTSNHCVKIYQNESTKERELKALQAGQESTIIPKVYDDGPNYIVIENIKGISLKHYLKKEKNLPQSMVEKILFMLDEMKRIGFSRIDTEDRHIFFNNNGDIKVIDLKNAFTTERNVPSKLLSKLKKRGFHDQFLKYVKQLQPSVYEEWIKSLD